ncbi:hypothetical protein K438DRAFT_1812248 [Mycena galopus ATCC 62051]|nr:hypothetical protein K438DRAFT_1812248 [Mycena galopus ATCC 62051]
MNVFSQSDFCVIILAIFVRCDGCSVTPFRQFHSTHRFMRPTEESIRHPSPLPATFLKPMKRSTSCPRGVSREYTRTSTQPPNTFMTAQATCTAGREANCDYNVHPVLSISALSREL